jgi:cobalamin-dependent methionine synthase I
MWDEFGAKTIEEYKTEKERDEKEHAEAVRREEERIKKEAENKRKAEEEERARTEEAVKRMKNMEVRVPAFPKMPKFKSSMEALAGLDLYIDSLDSYFKGLDREFSKVNYDLSGMSDILRRGVDNDLYSTKNVFGILSKYIK